jgi:hypothetical protein
MTSIAYTIDMHVLFKTYENVLYKVCTQIYNLSTHQFHVPRFNCSDYA